MRKYTLEAILQLMRAEVILSQSAKLIEKIALHLEYFGHITYLQPSVPQKARDYFAGQSSERRETFVHLYALYNRMESLWNSRQVLKKPMF